VSWSLKWLALSESASSKRVDRELSGELAEFIHARNPAMPITINNVVMVYPLKNGIEMINAK
jgi:hypothetical protein